MLLSPERKLSRRPLRAWARELNETLKSSSADGAVLEGCANQGALLAAHLGHPSAAKAICNAQLAWVARQCDRDPGALGHAIQPWINLGRLLAMSGSVESALRHFQLDRASRAGADVAIGPVKVNGGAWAGVFAHDPTLGRTLETVGIVEPLKSLLGVSAFDAVLRQVRASRPSPLALRGVIREVEVVALRGLARHDAVVAAVGWPASEPFQATVLMLQGLPSLEAVQGAARAVGRALLLGAFLQAADWGNGASPLAVATAAYALGDYLTRAGHAASAVELLRMSRDTAAACNDEVLEIQALELLARGAYSGLPKREWCRELDLRLQACEYAHIRRLHQRPVVALDGHPVGELVALLLRTLANGADEARRPTTAPGAGRLRTAASRR